MSLSTEPLFWTVALMFFTAVVLHIFTNRRIDFTKYFWSDDKNGIIETGIHAIISRLTLDERPDLLDDITHGFRLLVWLFMLSLFILGCVFFGAIGQSTTLSVTVPSGCDVQADGSGNLPMKGYNIMAFVNLLFSFAMFTAFLTGSVSSYYIYQEKLRGKMFDSEMIQGVSGFVIAACMISLLIIDVLWISGAALYSPYGDITSYNAVAISAFAFALLCLMMNFWMFNGRTKKLISFNGKGDVVFGIHELVLLQFITIDMYAKVLLFSDQVRVFTYVLTCLVLPMLMKPFGAHTYMYKYTVCNVVFWCAFYMFYVIFPGNVDAANDGFNPTQSNWLYYLGIWCNPSSFSLPQTSSLLYTIAVLTLVNTVFILVKGFMQREPILEAWEKSFNEAANLVKQPVKTAVSPLTGQPM